LPVRATVGSAEGVLCMELLSDNIWYVRFRKIWQSWLASVTICA